MATKVPTTKNMKEIKNLEDSLTLLTFRETNKPNQTRELSPIDKNNDE